MTIYSLDEIRAMQENEEWYDTIYRVVSGDLLANEVDFTAMSRPGKTLFGMRKHLFLNGQVLYRTWKGQRGRTLVQLIVPTPARKEVFRLAHEVVTGGHMGARRMLARIGRRYFWPVMGLDIRQWILACEDCASTNVSRLKKNKMIKHQVGAPMERVAMDVMGPLPRTTRGNKYILVIGDYFTKWMEAYPMPN